MTFLQSLPIDVEIRQNDSMLSVKPLIHVVVRHHIREFVPQILCIAGVEVLLGSIDVLIVVHSRIVFDVDASTIRPLIHVLEEVLDG
ncbi:unnamed protein product [Haemonchus placei]|uniref:Uncharacterized protein n=1 Tax=Haemonchus placei TaxID=6290 RepID=A0A0N4WCS5_HAEPC|nr:unnamed protein product [Haemonchus placei]